MHAGHQAQAPAQAKRKRQAELDGLAGSDAEMQEQECTDVQGLRSNVRTLTSTVRTLLGPTPALILLLAQCSNTCQRCCWHTVRTHICVRAEASDKIRAISSIFDIILAELCSQDVTNVF